MNQNASPYQSRPPYFPQKHVHSSMSTHQGQGHVSMLAVSPNTCEAWCYTHFSHLSIGIAGLPWLKLDAFGNVGLELGVV